MRLAKLCLLLAAGFISTHALAERTITDQLQPPRSPMPQPH